MDSGLNCDLFHKMPSDKFPQTNKNRCRNTVMSREDIFADRRGGDRRMREEMKKVPNGGCRRKASRRSGTRGFSVMPWYLRSNYTCEESIAPETEEPKSDDEVVRKVI